MQDCGARTDRLGGWTQSQSLDNGESTPLLLLTPQGSSDTKDGLLVDSGQPSLWSSKTLPVRHHINSSRSTESRTHSLLHRIALALSSRKRDDAASVVGVGPAAYLVRDAVLGEATEDPTTGSYQPYENNESLVRNYTAIICHRLCANRILLHLLHVATWAILLLTFIEPPHWCRHLEGGCDRILELQGPPADDVNSTSTTEYYPNTHSMLLRALTSERIELCCLCWVWTFILLRIGRDGSSITIYLRSGSAQTTRLIQLMALLALTIGLCLRYTSFHPYFRLVLVMTLTRSTHRDLKALMRIVPEVLRILLLVFFLVLFYAWFGVVLFYNTPEGVASFSNLTEALWTLFICITTANYPDVGLYAYNSNRWSGIYFVSFMIIYYFYLMNIVLASVVSNYEENIEQYRLDKDYFTRVSLDQAFSFLDSDEKSGKLSREKIFALFKILNEDFPEVRYLTKDDQELLFAILDKDGSSTIYKNEFMDLSRVFLLRFFSANVYQTYTERYFPQFYASDTFQRTKTFVKSEVFEYAIDAVLIINAIVICIQSYDELMGQPAAMSHKAWDGKIDTLGEYMEAVFTIIYCIEVFLKITVMSWRGYIESSRNAFDFIVTVAAVLCSVLVYSDEVNTQHLLHMIVIARILRLVRLVTALGPFQMIGRVTVEILPAASNVMTILFFLMFFYASMGMQLYGGLITRDPDNELAYLVLNTAFSDNNYWANNFNDMISSMNVLFNLLVVNNWTECEIGFEATTQAKYVRFFFLTFHICGVVLVSNLVVAFIIDYFMRNIQTMHDINDEQRVGEVSIQNRRAIFDAAEITGTKTSLVGNYIARISRSQSIIPEGRDRDRLRRLFTAKNPEPIAEVKHVRRVTFSDIRIDDLNV